MIDIPLSLRVLPQGRYNRGIYTCYECGFEPPHYNVVHCMLGLAETLAGTMVVRECPRCCGLFSRLDRIAGKNGCSTTGRRMPVKPTIMPPSSSLTAAAIPIGV